MSGGCHELRPLLGAYVLGALDDEESAILREHVVGCAGCSAELARLAPLPALLTLAAGADAAGAEPPPAALEERLLDAVAREAPSSRSGRRRRRRPAWRLRPGRRAWPAAGLATAVLAAGAVALVLAGGDGAGGYDLPLRASAAAPRATAWARLEQVDGGTSMRLWVTGMPADPGAVYEVHCDAPGWSASAGTFRVGPDGAATVTLTTAARRGEYDAIRIVRAADGRVVFSAPLI